MSENNLENEVHYVYGDQEYVLEQEVNPELKDLRAILVDGQYIVTDQTILLQEADANLTQYYINENGEDSSANSLFDGTECVQFIEEDTSEGQQIIYYTNEDTNGEEFTAVQELDGGDVEGIQDEDGNIYPFKRIKLEGQMLNFDEFVQQTTLEAGNDESLEYTIVTPENDQTESSTGKTPDSQQDIVDLSKITGRNLITGQTVTLHSYMEKLRKRLNKTNSSQLSRKSPKKIYNDDMKVCHEEMKKSELNDLLDKKISIGKTKSGKKIVGKIIYVEKKNEKDDKEEKGQEGEEEEYEGGGGGGGGGEEEEEEEEEDGLVINENISKKQDENENEEVRNGNEEQTRILVRKCTVTVDSFEQISKTLGGVMEMESVRKKLENKNIVVKLIEKKYVSETDSYLKSTSYSYGYMDQELTSVNDETVEKWKFVPDQDTQNALLGEHFGTEDGEEKKSTKFPITTSLTILITYEKSGHKTIRVNLNPAPGNLCTICAQYFKTNLQLRQHMNLVHNTYGTASTCELCDKTFDDLQKLSEHRDLHVEEGKLFACSKCEKCFVSQPKLVKHLATHEVYLRPLECSVCEVRCASEWSLKKHLLTHTGLKPFSCDICNKQFMTQYDLKFHKKIHFPEKHFACNICLRTFSRHSNLLRHAEIHKGTGALYKCEICYCSYNYISSLTRHMVQNHIDAGDFSKNEDK